MITTNGTVIDSNICRDRSSGRDHVAIKPDEGDLPQDHMATAFHVWMENLSLPGDDTSMALLISCEAISKRNTAEISEIRIGGLRLLRPSHFLRRIRKCRN